MPDATPHVPASGPQVSASGPPPDLPPLRGGRRKKPSPAKWGRVGWGPDAETSRAKASTLLLTALAIAVMLALLGPALRDNDQAALVGGAIQIARGDVPWWQAPFYNYDKQYGSYLLLALLLRLWPGLDPVLAGNLLQTVLLAAGLALVALRIGRRRGLPVWLVAAALASPVLVLHGPFLGTSGMSLAFLLMAFAALAGPPSAGGRALACLAVAVAAACRADAVLVVPALYLAVAPRGTPWGILRRGLPWALGFAAVLPVLAGRLIDPNRNPDFLGYAIDLKVWLALTLFGMGAGALAGLLLLAGLYAALAVLRPRWRLFHLAIAAAALLPLAFYSGQLSTPRYFLPSVAALLFLAASRRTAALLGGLRSGRGVGLAVRGAGGGVVAAALVPWAVGLSVPSLDAARPAVAGATRIPTADGVIPMGAYAAFVVETRAAGFALDHNHKIWLSAAATRFEPCEGRVDLLGTGMVKYLELAAVMQGHAVRELASPEQSACGFVYADARSLTRGYGGQGPGDRPGFFARPMRVASDAGGGQPVLRIAASGPPSDLARALEALRARFAGREFELHLGSAPPAPAPVTVPVCGGGIVPASACPSAPAAWAAGIYPAYMGK